MAGIIPAEAAVRGASARKQGRGAAQAGVAAGVADALKSGVISHDAADASVLIAAVWVNPGANDADAVYRNNRAATLAALQAGHAAEPTVAPVLDAAQRPGNPFYQPSDV